MSKPPLWRVMLDAYNQTRARMDPFDSSAVCCGYAAEIRAVLERILAELETAEGEGWIQPNLIELSDLEAILTTEADRAERGDQPTSQEH